MINQQTILGTISVVLTLLITASVTRADTINTSNAGQIATFQSGLTVQNFDALTAQTITDPLYAPVTATATILTDPSQPNVWFNSGGGNFFNPPATDPTTATKIGIFNPSGAIATHKLSPDNVAGPLEINTLNAFGPGAFMEVLFTTAVSSVGFYVPFISPGATLTLFLKDAGAGNIAGADSGGPLTAGQFIGINRAAADIKGLSLISSDGRFTIDDLTYGIRSTTGGGTAGGGGSTVPDTGAWLTLCAAVAFCAFARRQLVLTNG